MIVLRCQNTQVPYALARWVLIYKLKFLYNRSELSLYVYVLLLVPLLLEPLSYVTLNLILWGCDQVCHFSLMFVTQLRSLCSLPQ